MKGRLARSGRLRALRPAPLAVRRDSVSEHHGTRLRDPYRWLRDPAYPQVNDAAILAYLHDENRYFEEVMSPHQPLVDALFRELRGRYREDERSVPYRRGAWLYSWRFAPGAQYPVWFRRPAAGGGEEVLIDEPALAAGHAFYRMGGFDVSPDGRLLAWVEDNSGSERFRLRIRDLDSGEELPGPARPVIGSPVWAADSRHLFYQVLNDNWRPFQVRRRDVRAGEAADNSVYEEADDSFFVAVDRTLSEAFIVISTADHVTSELRVLPAGDPTATPTLVAARQSGHEYHLDHAHGRFWIRSNDRHRNFRLVSAPEQHCGREYWEEVIPPRDEEYLLGHAAFRDFLVVEERLRGLDQIRILDYRGTGHRVAFPEESYQVGLGANEAFDADFVRLNYSSLVTPDTVFDYRIRDRRLVTRKRREIPSGYDPSRYRTRRLYATARGGQRIPVSLVERRDRPAGGLLHLYAYGAYGIATPPAFSPNRLSLLDRGFAYAIAHVRGGDDLGYHWYESGKLTARRNTFNDFIDVARYLVHEGLTAEGCITISGGSAGGELVGAVLNDAPQLWAAAVAHVPFVDVLNTTLDASLPLTPIEWPEWGNPVEDADAFALIHSYSPYDQVRASAYPPLLVTAGLHDPRVTYWEPAKWVARLRYRKTDDNVLLLKTNMEAGHAGRSGRWERLRELAEEYAFLLQATAAD